MRKKYLVEKFHGKDVGFIYHGEYDTTKQVADAIGHSPSKTANAIADMKTGVWNRLGEYRIGIRGEK